jgi:hypothetical protein
MLSLSDEQWRERPFAIIGVIGSFVAIASFFLLPVGFGGMSGPLAPVNGWWFLLFLLSSFTQALFAPAFIIGLLIVFMLPGCSFITLFIGGMGLFRPVPHRWVRLFTLALWPGLILLGLSFFADFATFRSLWGFWGMGIGYLGILVGRYALVQEST